MGMVSAGTPLPYCSSTGRGASFESSGGPSGSMGPDVHPCCLRDRQVKRMQYHAWPPPLTPNTEYVLLWQRGPRGVGRWCRTPPPPSGAELLKRALHWLASRSDHARGWCTGHSLRFHGQDTPMSLRVSYCGGGGCVCPACARRATFVLTIPALIPDLPSAIGAPQVDQSGPQTFPTKHVA